MPVPARSALTRSPPTSFCPAGKPPADTMLTFDTPNPDDVEALVGVACQHGAKLVKPPYRTYYNTLQAVLLDPEGNIFRINHVLKA